MNATKKDKQQLESLRVAQLELVSGNTSGNVFVQLSPGAVFFHTDRQNAKEKIRNDISKLEQNSETIRRDN